MLTLSDIRARYGLPSDADLFDALAGGSTLPALLYVAREVHQLEQQKIFARAWQYACHDSQVGKPGDVVITKSGEIPIMILCGKDGELRSFYLNGYEYRTRFTYEMDLSGVDRGGQERETARLSGKQHWIRPAPVPIASSIAGRLARRYRK